ncbi:hypothetical protein VU04_01860 [Desulfobulbus sp. TB]|nr:hypothetical protein [Desulfobulbus sp. TB]
MPSYPRWISKFEIKPGSWVFVPSKDSISSGKKIKSTMEDNWIPPINYYHLRKGGHVAALKIHSVNSIFIHLDIKNFFGSINKSRVTRCLKDFFDYSEARRIAIESTVKHPQAHPTKFILPFGFVQSPIIASLCLYQSTLGQYLNKLPFKKNVLVSVYMDDIVISLNNKEMALDILNETKKKAATSRFQLNASKEQGPTERITVFNINLSYNHIEIKSSRLSKLLSDYAASDNPNQKKGYINYINSVNPKQSLIRSK